MEINQVKQFVTTNISRFKKINKNQVSAFKLYDKHNIYRGEYNFRAISSSDSSGVKRSVSNTLIVGNNSQQEMQEIIYMNKDYIEFRDTNSNTIKKTLPSEIRITTTVLDYINDKFMTIKTVSKLKNILQKAEKKDAELVNTNSSVVYEPLKEKPIYEKSVEFVRHGEISKTKKDNIIHGTIYG